MKFNFRKISAIAVSAIMAGMTLGVAAAANYPAPFVSTGGVANVAVVYGTGTAVAPSDLVQAGLIQTSLGTFVKGGTVSVTGGESFALVKPSDNFNYNDSLNGVWSTLNKNQMPTFLADGTYNDNDVDQDYTQKITLGSTERLGLFADNDYNTNKIPTLGFRWTNGQNILDYDLKMTSAVTFKDMNNTDMPLLGKTYYVLTSEPTKIVLLDSADKVVLNQGDSVIVGGKTVTVEFMDATHVKFNVDGELTNKLLDHGYEKLSDGSYIIANDIMYNNKETGISSVEFSIGKGKITLTDGETVKVNDKSVDGLTATISSNTDKTGLTNLNLAWDSDGETFLTETDAITMPVFGAIKLAYGGLDFPASPEQISFDNGDTITMSMGNYDLPILTNVNDTFALLGDDGFPLITATGARNNYTGSRDNASDLVSLNAGLDLMVDDTFLVTRLGTDLSDIDTAYYKVKTINWDGTDVDVELTDLTGEGNDITFTGVGADDEETNGGITMTIRQVNDTNAYLWFNASTGTISYNTAVSAKGLEVTLPAKANRTQTNDVNAGVALTLTEANKDGDLGKGMPFTATVKSTTNSLLHISTTNVTTLADSSGSKVEFGYVPSDLASKVTIDKTGDEYDYNIDYYGKEVTADVEVIGGEATVTSGESTLGNVIVKDTEVSSVSTKNLIVVGGSCINSAAAKLLGSNVPVCGAAWTTATGIGTGQFLIKGYASSTLTSGVALLVAGYDADDTIKATTYLTNKVVDTSKAYKGTTSTQLAVVIA
jgi:hypothetical protein